MNLLKGFPTRYNDAPPVHGQGWLDAYAAALPATNAGGIIILHGGYGTGKTRMAWEIARAYKSSRPTINIGSGWAQATKQRPTIYTTAVRLFSTIKSTYSGNSEKSETEVVLDYCDAALLVIDEVQERGETSYEDRQLTAIIDARYANNIPTMLISNYSWTNLAATLSPAIIDRYEENGAALEFNWPSYRKTTHAR